MPDGIDAVFQALQHIRCPQLTDEYDLHALAAEALQGAGIEFIHEARIAPRSRIDLLCGRIGVECKRGKLNAKRIYAQLCKYAQSERIDGIILLSEHALSLPGSIIGKPLKQISLSQLWGVTTDHQCSPETVQENKYTSACDTYNHKTDDAPESEELLFGEELPVGAMAGGFGPEEESQSDAETEYDGLIGDDQLDAIPLPAFLRESGTEHPRYFGKLHYIQRSKTWKIKAEPQVIALLKRLWPSNAYGRRGEIRHSASRRTTEDLSWIMQRWPLSLDGPDRDIWEKHLEETQTAYRRRQLAQVRRKPVDPPVSAFNGTLREFQKLGLSFLLMTPHALLADEMGLGKTVQALAALGTLRAFPALLVVPPHLVLNWMRETDRFLRVRGAEPRIHVIKGLTPYDLPDADVYIVHYLLLRGWKQALTQHDFRMIIFDEIQELRRTGSEKYSAASILSERCERVVGLSGTPIYNRGAEIWNVVNILEYHFLGDYDSFTREWCTGYGNQVVRHPEELGAYLRSEGLMLRRTKAEVLPELPEKRRLVQQIDHDDRLYQQLMRPVWALLEKLNEPLLTASERALLENEVSQGERQATGLSKAPFVCQFVRALVEAGEAVLLFAHHHSVMDVYKKELKSLRPAFITGRETTVQKEQNAARFMEAKTNLCCISLRAASGLNLQRATCVVFGELDWSPAVHSQAEDRAHRIGHRDSLLCYYLVAPQGSDMVMQEALGLKVSQFTGLMGELPVSEERRQEDANYARRHVEELLKRNNKKAQ